MEKDRKFRALAIAAICVAVIGVSVAYAALSTTLTISGTATIDTGASWNVAWAPGSLSVTAKDSSITFGKEGETQTPAIIGDSIKFHATFTAPNTSFTFKAKVRNNGTLAAKLQEFAEGQTSYITVDGNDANNFTFDVKVNGVDIDLKEGSILAPKTEEGPTDAEVTVTVKLKDMNNTEWESLGQISATFNLSLPFVQAEDGVLTPAL